MNDKLIAHKADKTISARNYIANIAAEKNLATAKKITGFSEQYAKVKELEIVLTRLENGSKERNEAEKELSKTTNILEALLNTHGLKLKNLEPNYYCKVCGDTGYVGGKTCKCKTELINKLRERSLGENGNDVPALSTIFSPFENDEQSEKYSTLKNKFMSLCESFPKNAPRFFAFVGKSGTGKTYFAKAIAKELSQRGFDTLTLSAFSLNNFFLKYHTSFDESLSESFAAACNSDVLLIDDLGTEPIFRNVTKEYLTNLLNERNNHGKLTIVTTNLSPDLVAERYDQRLASRLFDKTTSRTIPFDFDDLRKKSRQ